MNTLINPSPVPYFCSKAVSQIKAPGIYLLGMPFDGTSCFRKGADLGPAAFRNVSDSIESFSFHSQRDLEDYPLYDLGDVHFKDQTEITQRSVFESLENDLDQINFKTGVKLITLGGEHSISYPSIRSYLKQFPDLFIVHLDAHADLRDGYQGYHHSHASILWRVQEHLPKGLKESSLAQLGIRSGTRDEWNWMQENKTYYKSFDELRNKLNQIPNDRPVYFTLDLDFFDPSIIPGTGTPEAGGGSFQTYHQLCQLLSQKNLVGADITELAPNLDPTGISSSFGCLVLRELILSFKL